MALRALRPPSMILRRAAQFRSYDGERRFQVEEEDVLINDDTLFVAKSPTVARLTVPGFTAEWGIGRLPYVISADASGALFVSLGGYFDSAEDEIWRKPCLAVLRGVLPPTDEGSATAVVKMGIIPDRDSPISSLSSLGLLVLAGGGGGDEPADCIVAELQRADASDKAKLLRVRSGSDSWREVYLAFPSETTACWRPDYTIAHEGSIWWVDLSDGIVYCDPSEEHPVLTFVKLPKGDLTETTEDIRCRSCVGVSNYSLRFFKIGMVDSELVISIWTLLPAGQGGGMLWKQNITTRLLDIAADISYRQMGLPASTPALTFVHPRYPGVIYASLNEHVFGVDVCSRTVVDHVLRTEIDLPSHQWVLAWELSACSAERSLSCLEVLLGCCKPILSISELKIQAILLVADHQGSPLSCRTKERLVDFLDSVRVVETSLMNLNELLPQVNYEGIDIMTHESFIRSDNMNGADFISKICYSVCADVSKRLPNIVNNVRSMKEENIVKFGAFLKHMYLSTALDDTSKAIMTQMIEKKMVSDKSLESLPCDMKQRLMVFKENHDTLNKLEVVLHSINSMPVNRCGMGTVTSASAREDTVRIVCDRKAMENFTLSETKKLLCTLNAMLSIDEALKVLEDTNSSEESTRSQDDKDNIQLAVRFQCVCDDLIGEIYNRLASALIIPLPNIISLVDSAIQVNITQFKDDLEMLYISDVRDQPVNVDIFDQVMKDGDVVDLGIDIMKRFKVFKDNERNLELTHQALKVVCSMLESPDTNSEKRECVSVSILEAGTNLANALKSLIDDENDDKELIF